MKLNKLGVGFLVGFGVLINSLFALPINPNTIIGHTLYFASTTGTIGVRTYAGDGNYTGTLTLPSGNILDVNGTYSISGDTLTLNRTNPSPIILELVYNGDVGDIMTYAVSINGASPTSSYVFNSQTERDDAIADSDGDGFSNLEETLADTDPSDYFNNPFTVSIIDKTTYFASDSGVIGERTYSPDGNYTGSLTLTSGTTIAVSGTYSITGKVITLYRSSPSSRILVLTYLGQESAIFFSVSIDDADATISLVFDTEEERNNYLSSFIKIHPGLLMYLLN